MSHIWWSCQHCRRFWKYVVQIKFHKLSRPEAGSDLCWGAYIYSRGWDLCAADWRSNRLSSWLAHKSSTAPGRTASSVLLVKMWTIWDNSQYDGLGVEKQKVPLIERKVLKIHGVKKQTVLRIEDVSKIHALVAWQGGRGWSSCFWRKTLYFEGRPRGTIGDKKWKRHCAW